MIIGQAAQTTGARHHLFVLYNFDHFCTVKYSYVGVVKIIEDKYIVTCPCVHRKFEFATFKKWLSFYPN